jgi:hypothetical protein
MLGFMTLRVRRWIAWVALVPFVVWLILITTFAVLMFVVAYQESRPVSYWDCMQGLYEHPGVVRGPSFTWSDPLCYRDRQQEEDIANLSASLREAEWERRRAEWATSASPSPG